MTVRRTAPSDDTNGRRLGRQSAEQVYTRLKQAISIGEIPSEAPLVEATLAERYSVSRTPIRQALLALEQDGLVVRDGRSLRIRKQDTAEIIELYEIRGMLEEHAARLAARRHNPSDAIVLNHLVDQMASDVAQEARYDLNRGFHAAIWRAANHTVLLQTLERLYANSVQGLRTTLRTPDRWSQTVGEHRAMVEAILARDEERAAQLVLQHLWTARDIRIQASLARLDAS